MFALLQFDTEVQTFIQKPPFVVDKHSKPESYLTVITLICWSFCTGKWPQYASEDYHSNLPFTKCSERIHTIKCCFSFCTCTQAVFRQHSLYSLVHDSFDELKMDPTRKKTGICAFFFLIFLRHAEKSRIFFTKPVVFLSKNGQNLPKNVP